MIITLRNKPWDGGSKVCHQNPDCSGIRQLESSENFEIPADILESWNQAVKSRSRAAKNAVFQAFLRSGKDWSKLLGDHDFGLYMEPTWSIYIIYDQLI